MSLPIGTIFTVIILSLTLTLAKAQQQVPTVTPATPVTPVATVAAVATPVPEQITCTSSNITIPTTVANYQPDIFGPLTSTSTPDDGTQSMCRLLCPLHFEQYNPLTYSIRETTCKVCSDPETFSKFTTKLSNATLNLPLNGTYHHLCIPHAVCAKECKQRFTLQDGCVYTGSCTHVICFHAQGDDTLNANITGITNSGFGSVISFDNITVEAPSEINTRDDSVRHATDSCGTIERHIASGPYKQNIQVPFFNGLDNATYTQCRMYNSLFTDKQYEVVRNVTGCDHCNDLKSKQTDMCIPISECESKCGALKPGCMYTGSCASIFCLSGKSSKRPAVFPFFDDDASFVGVVVNDSAVQSGRLRDPPLWSGETDSGTVGEWAADDDDACKNNETVDRGPLYGGGGGAGST